MSREFKRKRIKRWIFPGEKGDKAILAFGGRPEKDIKIIMKAFEKGVKEHFTMVMKEDGSIDFHETKEGKLKSYTPLMKGTLNYRKIVEEFMKIVLERLTNPIDIKNPAYQDYIVLIPKSAEALTKFYEKFYIKGEKMIFPHKKTSKEIAESIENYFVLKYLPEISEYPFGLAVVINPEEEPLNYLIHANNAYFLIEIKEKDMEDLISKSIKIHEVHGRSIKKLKESEDTDSV